MLTRRTFLATSIALPALAAGRRLDLSRVSAITDEIARSPAEAIDFADQYGIPWLSLREVPAPLGSKKVLYHSLDADAIKQVAKEFKDAGIGIAFLDTPFLKFSLPGTEPKRRNPEDPAAREKRIARDAIQFDKRLEQLHMGIRAGQALGCTQLRIFTFSRVAEPESIFPRIAEIIGELAAVAQKEGFRLLIENEASQNVGTSKELATLLPMLPRNVGANWDSLNGIGLGEKPYPDGYETLPKDRIWNVHMKGKSLLDYPEHQDWPAILDALDRDGFQGKLELETHIFGEGQVAASHASLKEITRILAARQS